jgi:antitoxin HicB
MVKKRPHHGSTLDEFLEEEGLLEEVDAIVQKRVIAEQLREAMRAKRLSEAAIARRMDTSRTVVRNLLDPDNESVTLLTLAKAASAVGRRLCVTLEEPARPRRASARASSRRTRKGASAAKSVRQRR